jgi:hypothetical protein
MEPFLLNLAVTITCAVLALVLVKFANDPLLKKVLVWTALAFVFFLVIENAMIDPQGYAYVCNETSLVKPCGGGFECDGSPGAGSCDELNETQCNDIESCYWMTPEFCDDVSWWLKLEEASGNYSSWLEDQCSGNDFMRVGDTEQETALWTYGQHLGAFDDDWLVMTNLSALTTGSRSWRTIVNFSWKFGTGVYSDNESAFGTDWANFMIWEGDDGFYCYCRQADNGLRSVYAPVSINTWIDVLCSYDTADSNRLTIYVNGTSIASNTGAACDFEDQQGQAVIDSYPVVGALSRLDGVFDETWYRRAATNDLEAWCMFTTNTFDCNTESYCYGTPSWNCSQLGEYGGQEKCQETNGCYWALSPNANATCDSYNTSCYHNATFWSELDTVKMAEFWVVLLVLLIVFSFTFRDMALSVLRYVTGLSKWFSGKKSGEDDSR